MFVRCRVQGSTVESDGSKGNQARGRDSERVSQARETAVTTEDRETHSTHTHQTHAQELEHRICRPAPSFQPALAMVHPKLPLNPYRCRIGLGQGENEPCVDQQRVPEAADSAAPIARQDHPAPHARKESVDLHHAVCGCKRPFAPERPCYFCDLERVLYRHGPPQLLRPEPSGSAHAPHGHSHHHH